MNKKISWGAVFAVTATLASFTPMAMAQMQQSSMGGGMMGGYEDPMLTALTDINILVSDGLLPSICPAVGQTCFDNLKTAVKRGSKTYSKLVKDLTVLESEGDVGNMQKIIDFARMVPSFEVFNRLLSAADAMDAGDTEDALSALQSIVVKKGPFATMIKGLTMQVQSMSEELADQEDMMMNNAKQQQENRATRKAQEAERITMEKTSQIAPNMNGAGMYPQGSQSGMMGRPGMQRQTNPGIFYTPEMTRQFTDMQQNGGMMGNQPGIMPMQNMQGSGSMPPMNQGGMMPMNNPPPMMQPQMPMPSPTGGSVISTIGWLLSGIFGGR